MPDLIIATALCAASCRGQKNLTTERTSVRCDSLQSVRRTLTWQEAIPESRVSLKVPMDSVLRLPEGARYTARSGQASVQVGRDEDNNLVVESACDSIQRRCRQLEEEIIRIRNELQEQDIKPPEVVVHEPTGWQWFWIHPGRIAGGVCCLGLVLTVLKRRLKLYF